MLSIAYRNVSQNKRAATNEKKEQKIKQTNLHSNMKWKKKLFIMIHEYIVSVLWNPLVMPSICQIETDSVKERKNKQANKRKQGKKLIGHPVWAALNSTG